MQKVKHILQQYINKLIFYPQNYKYNKLVAAGRLKVGIGTYGAFNVYEYKGSEANIVIGNYTSIAPKVTMITGGMHPIKTVSQFPFRTIFGLPGAYTDGNPYTKGDIVVGSDVWICTDATILSGVKIGDGAIISAGAIVTKDVPAFAIAAGVPAKVVGYRFDNETIDALNKIKWWEWPLEKVKQNVDDLTSENIHEFINQHNKQAV